MKKKFFLIFMCFFLLVNYIPSYVYSAEVSSKDKMQKYIENLIKSDGQIDMRYLPFSEYDSYIYEKIDGIDYENFKNKYYINDFDFDTVIKMSFKNIGIDMYTQEEYEKIFEDIFLKLSENLEVSVDGNKEVSIEELRKKIKNLKKEDQDRIKSIHKFMSTIDEKSQDLSVLLDDRDFSEQYVDTMYEVYRDLRNTKDDFIHIISGRSKDFNLDPQAPDFTSRKALEEVRIINDITEYAAIFMFNYEKIEEAIPAIRQSAYQLADSETDLGKREAIKKAMEKVAFEHKNKFIKALSTYFDQVVERFGEEVKKQSKAIVIKAIDELAPQLGLGVLAKKLFIVADFSIFLKNLYQESSGNKIEVESTAKLLCMKKFNIALQCEFAQSGKKAIEDNNFSDEEYAYSNILFELCGVTQSLCYEYSNYLEVDGFWYQVHKAANFSEKGNDMIAQKAGTEFMIDRYLESIESNTVLEFCDGGQCGESVFWEVSPKGDLIIFGEGDMYSDSSQDGFGLRGHYTPEGSKYWDMKNITTVTFKGNVTSIGRDVFGCDNDECKLERVVLPDTIKKIEKYAFCNCKSIKEIYFPQGLESIGYCAFAGCESLTDVSLPNSITYLGESCFSGCKALEKINIPTSIKKLPASMVSYTNLKEIVIPESVEYVGIHFFNNIKNLKDVYVYSKNINIDMGLNDMSAGYSFTMHGYANLKKEIETLNHPFGSKIVNGNNIKYKPVWFTPMQANSTAGNEYMYIRLNLFKINKDLKIQIPNYLNSSASAVADSLVIYFSPILELFEIGISWDNDSQIMYIYN